MKLHLLSNDQLNVLHLHPMEYNKKQIIDLLKQKQKALENWFLDRPLESMELAPEGAWTAGQHLHHLIKSTKPLAVGMGYPRILLRFKFGKVNRERKSYEETVASYKASLDEGGKATGEFVPREVKKEEREALIKRFRHELSVLINQIHKWSEGNLDKTFVPHPLIGKLTLREMLYFTIYHMEHHLNTLNEKYK